MRLLKAAGLSKHCSVHRAASIPRRSHLHRGKSAVDTSGGCCLGRHDHEEGVAGVAGGARQLRREVCQLSVIVQPTLVRWPAARQRSASAQLMPARVLCACMAAMPAGIAQGLQGVRGRPMLDRDTCMPASGVRWTGQPVRGHDKMSCKSGVWGLAAAHLLQSN